MLPFEDPAVRRVAIVRLRVGLGDLICSLPAWRALRRARPDLRITVITWPEMGPLLERMGEFVDELLPFPGHPGIPERPSDADGWPAFVAAARDREFDLAVQAYGDRAAANTVTSALGAPRIGGFAPTGWHPDRDPALHLPYPREVHEVWRHLRLVEHLGVPLPADADALEFMVWPGERRAFTRTARNRGLHPGRYAVLHPGASAPTRCWPADRFALVGDTLVVRGLRVVLGGSGEERELTARVRRSMRAPAVDLAGETTTGQYALLLADAAVLVGNDTGAAHLAAAAGGRTVTTFLSGDPVRWAHRGPRHRAAGVPVGCNPCPHLDCPLGGSEHLRCATRLPVSAVLAAVDGVLAQP